MSLIRPNQPVCLILITYIAPLDEVDRHMDAHMAWLQQGFDAGVFVMAGRQNPRTGGVIVTRGAKAEAEALAASDPFVTESLATVEVIEFRASLAAAALADLFA